MDICLTQNRFCLPLPAMIWSIFAKIIRGKLEEISRMNPQTQCSRIEKKITHISLWLIHKVEISLNNFEAKF